MRLPIALCFLLGAAVLEAGGDAIVRIALHGQGSHLRRAGFLAAGALILLAYGCLVNLPRWDFGRLLGVYVCFFFLVAQLIAWLAFHQKPTPPILAGGAFILIGGCVISFWRK